MGACFSYLVCIISAVSFFTTDIAVYADSAAVLYETDISESSQAGQSQENHESLEEQNDTGESILPSIYKLYPGSEEFDIFDDEDEASYCS